MEIAHLLDFAVMVPNSGIQLFHKPLVSIWLVIVNRPEEKEKRKHGLSRMTRKSQVVEGREGRGKKFEEFLILNNTIKHFFVLFRILLA